MTPEPYTVQATGIFTRCIYADPQPHARGRCARAVPKKNVLFTTILLFFTTLNRVFRNKSELRDGTSERRTGEGCNKATLEVKIQKQAFPSVSAVLTVIPLRRTHPAPRA